MLIVTSKEMMRSKTIFSSTSDAAIFKVINKNAYEPLYELI
jgi:hypothetical protein